MCLAICGRIESIEGHEATAIVMGTRIRVNIDLIENLIIGEHVLIHTGFAIAKVDELRAKNIEQSIYELLAEENK